MNALATEPNASSFPPNAALATFLAPDVVVEACLCVYVRVKIKVSFIHSFIHREWTLWLSIGVGSSPVLFNKHDQCI